MMLTGETVEQQKARLREEHAWAGGEVLISLRDEVPDDISPDELGKRRLEAMGRLSDGIRQLNPRRRTPLGRVLTFRSWEEYEAWEGRDPQLPGRHAAARTRRQMDVNNFMTFVVEVCKKLNARNAKYVIGGGVAVNLHGYERGTKDVDILVPRDLDNTRRVLDALGELPMRIAREHVPEIVDKAPITIIGDEPRVDVLKGMGELSYKDVEHRTKTIVIDGTTIPFLSTEDLERSKKTGREQDAIDVATLKRIRMSRSREDGARRKKGTRNKASTEE